MTRFFHVEDLEKQLAAMFGFWSSVLVISVRF